MCFNKQKAAFPWDFFLLTFGFTWLILLPGILASFQIFSLPFPNILLIAIAQFGPSLTAFSLTYKKRGKPGVVYLLRQSLNFRIPPPWIAAIFLLPLFISWGAWQINSILGTNIPASQILLNPILFIQTFLLTFSLYGPVPEEFGWRGYSLTLLEQKFGQLKGSLLLGLIWASWHLPLFFMEGAPQSFMPVLPYFVMVIAFSVIMSWIYSGTNRNLLAALLTHTMFNFSIGLFPPMEFVKGAVTSGFFYLSILYAIAAIIIYFWHNHTRKSDQN
jgi:uncharacterized protein